MDRPEFVAAMAMAAVAGGAVGLRIEGIDNLLAVRPVVDVPIVGIVKSDSEDTPVRITVTKEDARALAKAGADIIAYDATTRPRQDAPAQVLATILSVGAVAMADCSTLEDAKRACDAGAEILGSTLSGYTDETENGAAGPDYDLISKLSTLDRFVMAEGRINTPSQAKRAMEIGADAVTVGTALTRLELVTKGFVHSIAGAKSEQVPTGYAIDLGGTKTAVARIENGKVVERVQRQTNGTSTMADHIDLMDQLLSEIGFKRGCKLGAAVTGRVDSAGYWHAVNVETMSGSNAVPLKRLLSARFGPTQLLNDAAAATNAEHKLGSGRGVDDFAYITVSTGVAGGSVLDGKLQTSPDGLAGHFGFSSSRSSDEICGSGRVGTVESIASGKAIANRAAKAGHSGLDARQIAERARQGEEWADEIMDISACSIADLAGDLRSILGIQRVAIGGSVGLSEGYIDRIRKHIATFPPLFAVEIMPAVLGTDAPLLGAIIAEAKC